MRKVFDPRLDQWRVKHGRMGSPDGNLFGVFAIPMNPDEFMAVISSGPEEWEHVSVSFRGRTPTWDEMCFVKNLFWGEEENVIQYHPPKAEYVNNHPHVLHLWKPPFEVPRPPKDLI